MCSMRTKTNVNHQLPAKFESYENRMQTYESHVKLDKIHDQRAEMTTNDICRGSQARFQFYPHHSTQCGDIRIGEKKEGRLLAT